MRVRLAHLLRQRFERTHLPSQLPLALSIADLQMQLGQLTLLLHSVQPEPHFIRLRLLLPAYLRLFS